MIHITTREVDDLRQCERALEQVLATLDSASAGIAAIHVNVAIEQLKKNLAVVTVDRADLEEPPLLFPDQNQ